MSDTKEEMRAAAMFEAECAAGALSKDTVIKALADALSGDSGKGHDKKGEHGIPSCNTCCFVEPHHADACPTANALRLAGRM